MAHWSSLPKELVTKIAEHIQWSDDFHSFNRVCSRWRFGLKEATFRACVHHNSSSSMSSPLLLLPEVSENSSQRRLFSLSKRMVRYICLPDCVTNGLAPIKLLASRGWLLMVTAKNRTDYIPILLNPMLRTAIQLPTISFQHPVLLRVQSEDYGPHLFHKFVLSDNPSTVSEFEVLLSIEDPHAYSPHHYSGYGPILMVWKKGDDDWKMVQNVDRYYQKKNLCEDITYFQGNFYGIFRNGDVVKFETDEGGDHLLVVVARISDNNRCFKYLVESDGKLLIIKRSINNRFLTTKFKVFEFDIETRKFEQIRSLGNRAIFIGSNSSFSVDVGFAPGFKPNCIYYTHDHVTEVSRGRKCSGEDSGVYSLMNEKTAAFHLSSETYYELTPLTWVESS